MSTTRTLELLPEQVLALGLESGDRFFGECDKEGQIEVTIVRDEASTTARPKMTWTEFTTKWAGAFKLEDGKTRDDVRYEYIMEKHVNRKHPA